jgi:hypothetical protein
MRMKTIDEPQPLRDLGLWFGDLCRYLWLTPSAMRTWSVKMKRVRRYTPRHSLDPRRAALPSFMRAWHLL